jgi:uncharacterized protein YjbI with pentapeptide repeats
MADAEQVAILKQGIKAWNQWRANNHQLQIDLSHADLEGIRLDFYKDTLDLHGANLKAANLYRSSFVGANLASADLTNACLQDADLFGVDLTGANLTHVNAISATFSWANLTETRLCKGRFLYATFVGANLVQADLHQANLFAANLNKADLSNAIINRANLSNAVLVDAKMSGAVLKNSRIYGVSAWNLSTENLEQSNLIMSRMYSRKIIIDNIKVAQFIHLLINNKEIRDLIDTITSKVVLILGRFTSERKRILDAIRKELPKYGYVPIMFDFEKPTTRGYTETISTLANMARFVIADITDAKVILQELDFIVKNHPSVPVQPILLEGSLQNVIVSDFKKYHSFLEIYEYQSHDFRSSLPSKIIAPVEVRIKELTD